MNRLPRCSWARSFSQGPAAARPVTLDYFKWFLPVQTRFKDNDSYGHMNNAVYHAISDSLVNVFLTRQAGCSLDNSDETARFMVKTLCTYYQPISFPNVYLGGLAITKLGQSSVDYEMGLFALNSDQFHTQNFNLVHGNFLADLGHVDLDEKSRCLGQFTHVFVDPKRGFRPTPIPSPVKVILQKLCTSTVVPP
ncbi:hypothetical protein TCAL_16726 [Tigriopus californicus]|uniref:Thioesterase domain-containing protein n=2 Tax=Tigriopus californicus TaxID=6832 RepID=A0A553PK75_TIGCA|nr:hypothetical protein TCAL_16726 [Tigriopus californicus]